MRRFFIDPGRRLADLVTLSEQESYHIGRVLRLQNDTEIELIDGIGGLFAAVIVDVGRIVTCRIVGQKEMVDKERVPLWVGQGLLKGKKMDSTIQQCTELGVTRLSPFVSSRCQGRPDETRGRRKSDRWERIVLSACKQCGRAQQMEIDEVRDFAAMLALVDQDVHILKLIFWEAEAEVHLHEAMLRDRAIDRACILLGPEGGFCRTEIAAAREQGWQTVSLGSHILRAETATLVAVSLVQYLLGNF